MDRQAKSFEFASQASKQLIALSTGIIVLTVTFITDLDSVGTWWILKTSWVLLAVSTCSGIWFLLALTGSLASSRVTESDLSIYRSNTTTPMWLQLISFALALVFTVLFGWLNVPQTAPQTEQQESAGFQVGGIALEHLATVGPFAEADTILEEEAWSSAMAGMRLEIETARATGRVSGVVALGRADSRPLAPNAAAEFGSNFNLAQARAERVLREVLPSLKDSVLVVAVPTGASFADPRANPNVHRLERRVDVLAVVTRGTR